MGFARVNEFFYNFLGGGGGGGGGGCKNPHLEKKKCFFLGGGGGAGGGVDGWTDKLAQTNLPLQLLRSWGYNSA